MNKTTCLIPVILASFSIAVVSGCKSTTKEAHHDEMIKTFEVKLTTTTQQNAEATTELALIVECETCPQPGRQVHPFGKVQFEQGQSKSIKLKTDKTIPWKDRNQLTLYLSTASADGFLPSHVWIAAISDTGERFTLRDTEWKNKMLSTDANDPEAISPMVVASEWVVALQY